MEVRGVEVRGVEVSDVEVRGVEVRGVEVRGERWAGSGVGGGKCRRRQVCGRRQGAEASWGVTDLGAECGAY